MAVITGAGSGIGRHAALALRRAGYLGVLAGRRAEALRETGRLARDNTLAVPTDVTEPESVRSLFAAADRFGRIDVLVNNAGIFGPALPVEDVTPEQWQR